MPAFAALADDTRLRIVEALARDERTVSDLVELFPISQPAVSRHLRLLREAGVVTVRPAGKQRIYRLDPAAVRAVGGWAERCLAAWHSRFDALGDHLDRMAAARVAREEASQT
ncbi:MAG TPA: metalloregulator ArsR/SmtB family transcription factor [Acidimicrobiales bacterium]